MPEGLEEITQEDLTTTCPSCGKPTTHGDLICTECDEILELELSKIREAYHSLREDARGSKR